MKILVTASFFSPYISGLTLYTEKLSEALFLLGHKVTVLTNRHNSTLPKFQKTPECEIVRLPVHFFLSKAPVSLWLLPRSLKLALSSSLIIINLPSLESPLISLVSKLFHKPLVAIHHCDPIVPGNIGKIITPLSTLANFLSCFLSDRIITYTSDYARHSPVLRFFLNKSLPILPPIPISDSDPKQIRQIRKKIGPSGYTIGFAGRFSEDKGIKYLLEAIPHLNRKLKHFRIVICGPLHPIGETYFDTLAPLLQRYSSHITFLGPLPQHQMVNFYKNLDCLILPSINRTESFGMVQIEAMLAGVPVVATDLPGVRQPIIQTQAGLIFPPQDPVALADAVFKVVTNPGQFHPRNLSLFSPKGYQVQLEELLKSITPAHK